MNREAFEKWYVSANKYSHPCDLAHDDKGEYVHRNTDDQYQAWQAATEAQQDRIDELHAELERVKGGGV